LREARHVVDRWFGLVMGLTRQTLHGVEEDPAEPLARVPEEVVHVPEFDFPEDLDHA
jgi:hypothetical protein